MFRDENACPLGASHVVKSLEIREAVAFQVQPLRHLLCAEDFFPQGGSFYGSRVGEPSAVAFEADRSYLELVGDDVADSFRQINPIGFLEKIVADFDGTTGVEVETHRMEQVLFGGFEDFGADQAD